MATSSPGLFNFFSFWGSSGKDRKDTRYEVGCDITIYAFFVKP